MAVVMIKYAFMNGSGGRDNKKQFSPTKNGGVFNVREKGKSGHDWTVFFSADKEALVNAVRLGSTVSVYGNLMANEIEVEGYKKYIHTIWLDSIEEVADDRGGQTAQAPASQEGRRATHEEFKTDMNDEDIPF